MACASAMLHIGTTMGVLVLARSLQGLAAAVLYSAGLALLCDAVGEENLGQAMGYISLAITAGTFLGPSLGGILYNAGGESAVFGVAYAVIIVDIILRSLVAEKRLVKMNPSLTNSSHYGTMPRTSSESDTGFQPSIHSGVPKLQDRFPTILLLTTPRLLNALYGWFVVGALLTAFDCVLPIFVQSTFRWSTAGAGVIFLPLFLPNLAGPLYGRLVDSSRHAGRVVASFGFILCLPFFVLLRFTDHETASAQVLLCGMLFMIGLGLALCGPPLLVEVARTVSKVGEEHPGVFGSNGATATAYGLYNCAFAGGQLLGPLCAGAIISSFGWATLTWILGLASGLTGVVMSLFLGGWVGKVAFQRKSLREEDP